jgi:hypothetical protein
MNRFFIAAPKHDAKVTVQEKSVSSIQPVSNVAVIAQNRATAAPTASEPIPAPNVPQIGSSSAADVPSSIASLSLYGASPATDADTGAIQGGYGIPDQDGDNDGK